MLFAPCCSVKAVQPSGRCLQSPRHCAAKAFRTSNDKYESFRQAEESFVPPPPPPPPPPFFDEGPGRGPRQSPFGQPEGDGGQLIIGAGMAALVALGFVYGFREDDSAALRAARSLPPPSQSRQVTAAPAPPPPLQQQQATFPSTVLPGEVPIGLQGQWEHNWRYDANGQPFLQLKGRWWRLERQAGSRLQVTFYDTQNKLRPGLAYVYTPPPEWPVDEVDLTNQVTMALLFGQEEQLEDRLQLVE